MIRQVVFFFLAYLSKSISLQINRSPGIKPDSSEENSSDDVRVGLTNSPEEQRLVTTREVQEEVAAAAEEVVVHINPSQSPRNILSARNSNVLLGKTKLARMIERAVAGANTEGGPAFADKHQLLRPASRVFLAVVRFLAMQTRIDSQEGGSNDELIEEGGSSEDLVVEESGSPRRPSVEFELYFQDQDFYVKARSIEGANDYIPVWLKEGMELTMMDQNAFKVRWIALLKDMQNCYDNGDSAQAGTDQTRFWDIEGLATENPRLYIRIWHPFECSICTEPLLTDIEPDERYPEQANLILLDCFLNKCSGSVFHDRCIAQWFRSQQNANREYYCPVCRSDVKRRDFINAGGKF